MTQSRRIPGRGQLGQLAGRTARMRPSARPRCPSRPSDSALAEISMAAPSSASTGCSNTIRAVSFGPASWRAATWTAGILSPPSSKSHRAGRSARPAAHRRRFPPAPRQRMPASVCSVPVAGASSDPDRPGGNSFHDRGAGHQLEAARRRPSERSPVRNSREPGLCAGRIGHEPDRVVRGARQPGPASAPSRYTSPTTPAGTGRRSGPSTRTPPRGNQSAIRARSGSATSGRPAADRGGTPTPGGHGAASRRTGPRSRDGGSSVR